MILAVICYGSSFFFDSVQQPVDKVASEASRMIAILSTFLFEDPILFFGVAEVRELASRRGDTD